MTHEEALRDYPGHVDDLVQSLSNYINCTDEIRRGALVAGEITIAEAKEDATTTQRTFVAMLENMKGIQLKIAVHMAVEEKRGKRLS